MKRGRNGEKSVEMSVKCRGHRPQLDGRVEAPSVARVQRHPSSPAAAALVGRDAQHGAVVGPDDHRHVDVDGRRQRRRVRNAPEVVVAVQVARVRDELEVARPEAQPPNA